jgi:hypothetical protein
MSGFAFPATLDGAFQAPPESSSSRSAFREADVTKQVG